jgi:exodeoxyribonuclease-3
VSLRIATWNVNSLRRRLDHLARFAEAEKPDVICLQETKVSDEEFPRDAILALGYPHIHRHGQKARNGVAILSRQPFESETTLNWCGREDRRHACVRLAGGLEIHDFYVPAGGAKPDPEANDKFAHKLQFLDEMAAWAKSDLADRKAVLVGDLNVAPLETDVWNHKQLVRSVGHTPVESARMAALLEAGGLIDAPRRFVPADRPLFTWWGYRFPAAFEKDYGWRLDHILVTPALGDQIRDCRVLRDTRAWPEPSDHVPVILDLL